MFADGGFNLGRLNFTFNRELDYNPPISNAGEDILVVLPNSSAILDGSLSSDLDTDNLNFQWEQIYGPNAANVLFPNNQITDINDLIEGTYKFKLTVDDNSHSSIDHIFVFVSSSENFSPTVSLNTSNLASSYYYGSSIELLATANDIDGAIEKVEFYDNDVLIAELFEEPYSYVMHNLSLGMHTIKVIAYDDDGLSSEPSSFEIES